MENNENKNKIGNTGPQSDTSDGYMQISSSGRALRPTPRRTVTSGGGVKKAPDDNPKAARVSKAGAKHAAVRKTPMKKTPMKKTPAKKTEVHKVPPKGVEYSFTNSGLFNNSEITQNAAIQERNLKRAEEKRANGGERGAEPVRKQVGARADSTKVMPTVTQKKQARGGVSAGMRRDMPMNSRPAPSNTKTMPAVSSKTKTMDAVKAEKSGRIKYPPRPWENKFAAMNSITRAIVYIAAVLVSSIILSVIVITNCNDIFAFVKSDEQISITIEEGTDLPTLAKQLKKLGVISHKNTFKMYIKYRGKDSDSYTPGTYTVSPSMNYDQIISAITPKVERESVVVTIPEGFTVDDIIELFLTKFPDTTRQRFVEVIQNYDFDTYWFIKELPKTTDKIYRLEGYLFPDTYYFYTDMNEETIISKLLDNFEKKYTDTYKTRADQLGYTTDQVVTLASIVQAEGKEKIVTVTNDEESMSYVDYGLISSVFSNRMGIGMKLQSDATTAYAVEMGLAHAGNGNSYNLNVYTKPEEYNLSEYTKADYQNPYNTYYVSKFPPGGICNPGLNAISFALWPDSSQYLYFVSDSSGTTHFTKSLDEHYAMVKQIQ